MEIIMELKERFEYKDGGLFAKTFAGGNAPKVGDRCGSLKSSGYRDIRFNGAMHKEHRLIWEMFNGPIPNDVEIDHINRIRDDNRIENLRLATRSQNQHNRTDTKGVSLDNRNPRPRWRAILQINKVKRLIGTFDTEEEAHEAYLIARKEVAGDYAPA